MSPITKYTYLYLANNNFKVGYWLNLGIKKALRMAYFYSKFNYSNLPNFYNCLMYLDDGIHELSEVVCHPKYAFRLNDECKLSHKDIIDALYDKHICGYNNNVLNLLTGEYVDIDTIPNRTKGRKRYWDKNGNYV